MKIYIPQNIDPFNTHLKNLAEAYSFYGNEIITGFRDFISDNHVPDIVHFHFLEPLLKYLKYDRVLFFDRMDRLKQRGVRFIYTFHDARPHSEISAIDYPTLFRRFLDYVSLFIHHGRASVEIIKEKFPVLSSTNHIVCHHGDYLNDMKMFHESREEARKILRLPQSGKIILIFGQLQYKNPGFAQEVFARVRMIHPGSLLVMAGVFPVFPYNRLNKIYYRFNNTVLNRFRSATVRLHKRFSQYETYLLFTSADVIFLPHKAGLTTGLIPLAATLSRPFVYPGIGVFEEQAENCVAEKYVKGDIGSASDALNKILSSGTRDFDNSQWLKNNNWNDHVRQILSVI